jgi:GGDEF domain-containing protein
VARYGGEEAADILSEAREDDAVGLADKIREPIEVESLPGE